MTPGEVLPAEPTREMWAAMADALVGYKQRHHDAVAAQLYDALRVVVLRRAASLADQAGER